MKAKNILKLSAVCAAIMTAGMAQIYAAQTNLVQHISFALTCYTQGSTNQNGNTTTVSLNKFKMTTKDVITAIGTATTNNFSSKARLVLVKEATASNSTSFFEVRDETNPPVDVSSFFSTRNSEDVRSSSFDSATGIRSGVAYSIFHLDVTNAIPTVSLRLRGFATTTHTSIKIKKDKTVLIGVDSVEADVAGTSIDTNNVTAVVTGSVTILGKTLIVE